MGVPKTDWSRIAKYPAIECPEWVEPLSSGFDASIYGFRCRECGGWWKFYQNEWHKKGCVREVKN